MGQLTSLAPAHDAGRLIVTDHPVLIDGRRNIEADLRPGESLYSFLSRHVGLSEQWEVRVGGEVVPVEYWMRVKPKHGQVIEVVHAVNRQALYLVAMIALTYFTFGVGAAAGGWAGVSAAVGGGIGGAVAAGAVYVAGSILINKVLGPKPPEPVSQSRDSVYSITSARNQARPYDPVALLMGHSYITPDLASMPYVWHEGDDQYLGMVLNVGINVHDVGDIYHGEGLLSQFDGVQVYYSGIPGKPDQKIPLYSNADTIQGGALEKTTAWVQRTTPTETRRIQINIEGQIGDVTSKGKDYYNAETIQAEYRPVGSGTWQPLTSRVISNANGKNYQVQRVTLSRDVAEGQYEVRVRRLYTAQDKDKGDHFRNATSEFQWTTMVAVQADDATYAGMGRIGIRVRATGQLSGALDQLRMEAWSRPVPVWNGSQWVTEATSNPGALILQFLRGIHDENGRIIAGLGLDEDEIDIPSLQAFMVHCAAEGYEYNHYLRDVRNNGDQLDAMARAGFGAMSWESGRWGVVWAADGQPVSGVVNMATIKKGQFQVDYTLAQAADGIEYTYLDSSDWTVKTLRVPAPGVDVMLNPATVQAEGVSTEAHAAQMARWHLAQSLYQYKDIVFSTDLEHLAYKRMDVLQLQHDLTQWGYGGRLVAVDGNVLTLDEPVPGNAVAWIGVRVPGEAVYRTLRVQSFTGESDTIELLDPWPGDAPLPDADNPAHDYIWIYDFKATPGYRVRVVGKELESDAKGASVAVVPEGPEFWNYVKTGEYIPPQPGSLLDTRPKASNVAVSEVQVVTGDVVHTELAVTFDLKGPAARTVIFAGVQGSEIGPVAETVTQTARFRIGSAGTYTIVVRPYNADGIAGESATVTYTTEGTDIPPPPFDWATVEVGQSGLRRYAWGYHQYQPADLAGAEIRFMPGTVADPDWEAMTPLGADGFFTAAFESDVPVAGDWTFAFAAINTAGELSAPVVTHVTLAENVGEHLQDHEDRITSTQQIAQEILDDFADMAAEVDRVEAEAKAAAAALNLRADQLRDDIDATMAQLNDILGAEEWDAGTAYDEGDLVQLDGKLYRALQAVPAGTPVSNTAYWEQLGEYASIGDAVAAALSQLSAHADELLAHAESLNLLGAKNGAGTAWLLNMDTVRVSASETMAQWRSSIQSSFTNTNARIDSEVSTLAAANSATASRVEAIESSIGRAVLVQNGSFENDLQGWTVYGGVWDVHTTASAYHGNKVLRYTSPGDSIARTSLVFQAEPGDRVVLSAQVRPAGTISLGGRAYIYVRWRDKDGVGIQDTYAPTYFEYTSGAYVWTAIGGEVVAPAGAASGFVFLRVAGSTAGQYYFDAVTGEILSTTMRAHAQLIESNTLAIDQQDDFIQGVADDLELLDLELHDPSTGLASKASIGQFNTIKGRIDDTGGGRSIEQVANALTVVENDLPGKANTTYVQAVESTANAAASQASANLSAITGMSATVGGHTASINELREVSASSVTGNAVINPSFESDGGWALSGTDAQIITTSAAITGTRALRIQNGNGTAISLGRAKVRTGQRLRLGGVMRPAGSFPNSGAKLRLVARRYDASGTYLAISTVAEFDRPNAWQNFPFEGAWTVPSGTAEVAFQIQTVSHTSGGFTIDDVYLEPESATLSNVMAKYSLAVTAGGDVAGMQLLAGGGTSAIRFLSETVGFYSSDGAFELANGRQISRSNGYMRVEGKPFGSTGDLLSWYGPEQSSLNNCTKANGLFWLDNKGDGYFAGRVLQGVLRWFNSTTSTSSTASVTTGNNPRLGKQVSLSLRYQYQQRYRYRGAGASVSPGNGQTAVTVQIERRYGSGTWTTLATQEVMGQGIPYNGEPGENLAIWTNVIDGTLFATDTASTSNSEYRARISGRTTQAHSGAGTADPVETTQYLSIEAME